MVNKLQNDKCGALLRPSPTLLVGLFLPWVRKGTEEGAWGEDGWGKQGNGKRGRGGEDGQRGKGNDILLLGGIDASAGVRYSGQVCSEGAHGKENGSGY